MIRIWIVVFWVMISCAYFRVGYYPENGDSNFLQNTGNHLPDYIVSLPRSPQSKQWHCPALYRGLNYYSFYVFIYSIEKCFKVNEGRELNENQILHHIFALHHDPNSVKSDKEFDQRFIPIKTEFVQQLLVQTSNNKTVFKSVTCFEEKTTTIGNNLSLLSVESVRDFIGILSRPNWLYLTPGIQSHLLIKWQTTAAAGI